jgi:hypothetical protein
MVGKREKNQYKYGILEEKTGTSTVNQDIGVFNLYFF